MRVYYVDISFFLNFIMDYLSLAGMLRLLGLPLLHKRLLMASLLGGCYGALAMVPQLSILRFIGVQLLLAYGMVRITYGKGRLLPRCTVVFFLVSAVLSGGITFLQGLWQRTPSPVMVFLLSGGIVYGALTLLFSGNGKKAVEGQLLRARLTHGGKSVTVTLLQDSGNLLKDPATGQTVCIVEKRAIEPLIQSGQLAVTSLPFQALGQENGILSVFYCDNITICEKNFENYPVGMMEQSLSDGSGFVGLWGQEETYAKAAC